jgi:hypothetical protein
MAGVTVLFVYVSGFSMGGPSLVTPGAVVFFATLRKVLFAVGRNFKVLQGGNAGMVSLIMAV